MLALQSSCLPESFVPFLIGAGVGHVKIGIAFLTVIGTLLDVGL
jgi:hypothetical protein